MQTDGIMRNLRLNFIFVVAFEKNWAPDTDLSTWIWHVIICVIHFRDISKFHLCQQKKKKKKNRYSEDFCLMT